MKRAFAVSIILLFLVGCASMGTNYKQQTYNSLLATANLYNVSWQTFKEMKDVGAVSDADYQAGKQLAIQFYDKYQMAVDLMLMYEKGTATQGQMDNALAVMQAANRALLDYLKPRIQKGVPK
jgi:hypothetical protein